MRKWLYVPFLFSFSLLISAQTAPTFTQNTIQSVISSDTAIGIKADLNSDGVPDLVLCCDGNGQAAYQLATGTGSFEAPVSLPGGVAYPGNTVVSGDFNNDGRDDILVVNGSRSITIYYNNGGGNFTPQTYFPNANTLQVAVGDFNHDGNLDIAYIPNSVSPVQVFVALGDGKGGFTSPTQVYSLASAASGWDLVVGDFDGDHNADLAFTVTACFRGGCNPSTVYVLYGSGTGKFTASSFANSGELRLTSVDVNQDGRSDLAISKYCPDGSCTDIGALFGNANRTFTEAVSPANSADANVIAVADLNGDLKNDLVDSYGIDYTMGAYLGLATSASTWNKQVQVPLSNAGFASEVLITGDFNRDRKPDIAIYQAQQGVVQLLQNTTATGKYGACAYPTTGQGIHVCSPAPGGNASSPVHFRTAANSFRPIRKTELWIDGVKITEQFRSWLDYKATVPPGIHNIDVYVNNYDDDFQRTTFSLTVK